MKIDYTNSRALGTGERIERGDYARPIGSEDEWIEVMPYDSCCGEIVAYDDMVEYRRLLHAEQSSVNLEAIAAEFGIETAMGKKALAIALDNIATLDRKQKDYGSDNIAAFGEYGCLVRCTDKLARLRNLLTNVADPKNEALEDSWLDLSNYCLIAVLNRRNEWR
jgi:hypothetical protein